MKTVYFVGLVFLLLTSVVAPPPKKQACRRAGKNLVMRKGLNNVIDLTYVQDKRSAHWPAFSDFELTEVMNGENENGIFIAANSITTDEHVGTHMDAPVHFVRHGHTVDEISLDSLIGPGVLVNLVKNGVRFGGDSLVKIEHFLEWEKKHGRIRTGSIVLVRTGFGDVYYDRAKYYGTNLTGEEAIPDLHYPGIDPDAAEWLVHRRCISAIGLDVLSIDYGQSKEFRSHVIFSKNDVLMFENVANLHLLSESGQGFNVVALPMNIKGGTGAPTRIVAFLK